MILILLNDLYYKTISLFIIKIKSLIYEFKTNLFFIDVIAANMLK